MLLFIFCLFYEMQLLMTSWMGFLAEVVIELPFWWFDFDERIFPLLWCTYTPDSFQCTTRSAALLVSQVVLDGIRKSKSFSTRSLDVSKWPLCFFATLQLQPSAQWGESFSKHLWFAIVIVFLAEMGRIPCCGRPESHKVLHTKRASPIRYLS